MKINRLLEMVTILLNRETVTAKELADRFGVSSRTIYRDIDVLSENVSVKTTTEVMIYPLHCPTKNGFTGIFYHSAVMLRCLNRSISAR